MRKADFYNTTKPLHYKSDGTFPSLYFFGIPFLICLHLMIC